MGMQYIPAFQLCMSFQDLDVARKIIWKRTKTIFITVITCTACLWLFQFPIAVSLMKSSLPKCIAFWVPIILGCFADSPVKLLKR